METHEEKSTFKDMFLRTIAVLGLIAVLLLGAWGIIQLAVAIPSIFGNIGNGISSLFTHSTTANKETLAVSSPASLTSGQSMTVSWVHKNNDGQYSYTLSYACQDGLSLKAPLPNGSYQTVGCNTPFNYVNASQRMTVVPTLTGTTVTTPLSFTVSATKLSTGVITTVGTSTTLLAASGTAAPVKTPVVKKTPTKSASTYYAAPTRAALYGYGDLQVTITSVSPSAGRTSVQFTVANVGTNVVNSGWTFNATLPVNGSYSFASQPQQALYPGDKIVYTLAFSNTGNTGYNNQYPYATGYQASGYTCNGYTNCMNGTTQYPYQNGYTTQYPYGYNVGNVVITADPSNMVAELNKNNNSATASVPLY